MSMQSGALYIRVSTGKQEELSPDAQKRLLLDYAKRNQIYVSDQYIYQEDGISGRKAEKRPQFINMIAAAKSSEHPFDVILVWKYSRFARNQEESIVYKAMLKRENVDVVSVSEPISDDPFGTLIERIIEWMDEYYSIRLSGEVTRGMTENALRGNYQCSPPLGYKIPYRHAVPQIVPEKAEIVKLIFDLYTEQNMGQLAITRYLNEHGYKTRNEKTFARRQVNYILSNPFYCGKVVWNKRKNGNEGFNDESDWIIRDGQHEPIITVEQFEQAKQKMSSSAPVRKHQKPPEMCHHWLSGITKCVYCGGSLLAHTVHDKKYGRDYVNFHCANVNRGRCNAPRYSIAERKLAPVILDSLESTLDSGEVAFSKRRVHSGSPGEYDRIKSNLKELAKKEARIKEAYRNGIDTIDEYRDNKAILSQERERLKALLSSMEPASDNMITEADKEEMLARIRNFFDMVQNDKVSVVTKNAAAKTIFERIDCDIANNHYDIFFFLS
ncbi:MAG: recombinase family protein [Lachnospiraceae bacterium]|nr:recombinase family protein [Lachnospiraceae bacterium]